MTMNHAQRVLQARMAAHTRWANEPDRKAATAAARQGLQDRFERQVDPEGILSPRERSIRAGHAQKAHMLSISLKAAQKRSRKTSASSHQEDTDTSKSPTGVGRSTAPDLTGQGPNASSHGRAVEAPSGSGASSMRAVEPDGHLANEADQGEKPT